MTTHKILVEGAIVVQAKTLYEDCSSEIANRSRTPQNTKVSLNPGEGCAGYGCEACSSRFPV